MISPLSDPPSFISAEEHSTLTSSTPGSFVDIPPVLRWGDEADISMTPKDGGWESWPERLHGKVWVTEECVWSMAPWARLTRSAVAFLPSSSASGSGSTLPGFSLPYPSLTLHALVPGSSEHPAHVYCQIDESDAPPRIHLGPAAAALANGANGANGASGANGHATSGEGEEEEEEGGEGEEEYSPMREVRIYVPQEKLEPLFAALSACSALHENTVFPGQEDDGGFGFFPSMPDGGESEWITADNVDDIDLDEEEGEGGEEGEGAEEGEGGRDPVQRFIGLVDWGNVPKPDGWEEAGQYTDAPKE